MLYVSFGIGAFLAPVLLLSFTGITADETMKLIPLRYETVPLHLSTALADAQPSRSDLISPHVLARKRRSAFDQMWDNITDRENLLKQFTSDEFSNMSTVEYLSNVDKSTEPGVSSEYESRSAEFNIRPFTTTANVLFNNVNGQVTPDTNTSIAVVANDSSAVLLLNTTAAGFIVASSTTKMPKKPLIANGEILDPHRDVADSRKFRDQIRQNLAKPVPDVALPVNPSSTSTLQASVFSTFSANSSVPTQNFSSSPKVNLSGLQPDNQTLSVDGGDESRETKALPLSTLPSSAEWSSSFHLGSLLSAPIDSSPSSMPKSLIQSVSPSPPVSVMNITLRNTTVLASNALPSSTVALLKSTSAPSTPSNLSSEILTGVLNGTESTVKPTRLAMWLSKYSYWTAAFMIGLAATAFAFYCVLCPRVYQTCLSFEAGDPTGIIICRFPACFIAVLFHLFYGGLEASFAVLITSFAVVVLEWSWWLGVMLSLVFWGSFSVGRLINYVFFSYLHQSVVLFGSLLVCITVAGSAFISFQPSDGIVLHSSIVVIWLLVGILGFVMSAILPAGVAEIDKFLPRHSEFFQLLGASVGEMMLPPLIGIIVAMHDTVWLVYILLSIFVLCIIISTVVHFLVVQSREVRAPRASRLLQSSECNDLEDVLVGTNDETELLAKSMYSHPGSTLNGHTNVPLPATSSAIQSLMKNINNVKID